MKKRGLSLFLALALCLTLLPAAAFANGESETSTLHTHYLCGNAEACSHVGGHSEDSKTTFATAITQDENGYVWVGDGTQEQPYQCVLSEGTYYLATDLALEAPSNTQFGSIQIMENVTLCLNGHTITVKANREAFKITKSVDTPSPTLTLTDCQGGGKITHDSSFLGNGVNLSENCNFIMYGGSITGNTTTGGENTTWRSGGVWVRDNSTFTMYGGSITGNHNSDGGGVWVENTGSFTMYGGSITGNSVSGSGGGVYVSAQDSTQGRFAMYGGSITGNNVSGFVGSGGVCVYGTMTVSGSVRITENVNGGSKDDNGIYTGGTASNVRLVGRSTITIGGPLTEGSQIGVSLYSNRIFTSGWSKNMSDKTFSSYFTADDSSSTVALENGELKLSNPHTHSWTYALSTTTTGSATITATCKNCAENNNTDFHGGSVTIAAPEADALTYDSSPKATAVTTSGDWPGASADNIRITYKQGETTLSAAPTDAGIYTAGITVGEGGGAVTASVEYTIAPKELTDPTIKIASGSVYDGNAKTPNVTVKDGENTIAPSEYAVSYDNNVNAGENTATVTIMDNANGNYTVSGSAKFSIAKADSACTAPTPI